MANLLIIRYQIFSLMNYILLKFLIHPLYLDLAKFYKIIPRMMIDITKNHLIY